MLPVAPNPPARVVRAVAGVGILALVVDDELTATHSDIVAVLVIFGVYFVGFVVVTGRWAPVSARGLAVGAVTGVASAVLPMLVFMVWPPVPVFGGWTMAVVALAAVVAGAVTAGPGDRPSSVLLAGLLAAMIAALLLPTFVSLVGQVGPESWVPQMMSHALTPADRLAERRQLAGDHYLPTLLIGDLLALATGVLALQLRTRAQRPAATPGSGRIELTPSGTSASTDPARSPRSSGPLPPPGSSPRPA